MKFKIYDSVPVPNRVDRRSYPFKDLEVDQCFKVECDRKQEKSVRSSATHWNNKHPERRYIVRRLPDDGEEEFSVDGEYTLGVWRVK